MQATEIYEKKVFPPLNKRSHLSDRREQQEKATMNAPQSYTAEQIKRWDVMEKRRTEYGSEYWVPARPEHIASLRKRITLAWRVFIGKCDALEWGQP